MEKHYDVIVIGGGPAGCTAAMYAVRAGFSTLILEKIAAGGQMNETGQIDNFPGHPEGIDGYTLGQKFLAGATRFGADVQYTQVLSVRLEGREKQVQTTEDLFNGKTIVIATGAGHRRLGLPEEESLIGKGVAYCAACDGGFYRGKMVAVVGGGNSAAADALLLSRIAKKVYLIHRRDSLRATKIYHDPLKQSDSVEFRWNSQVTELLHHEKLTGIRIENIITGEQEEISLDGLFISVGRSPATELFRGQLSLDEGGYIVADETTKTNIPGVYAAGDVRTKQTRQIVTAAADGAAAAAQIERYFAENGI